MTTLDSGKAFASTIRKPTLLAIACLAFAFQATAEGARYIRERSAMVETIRAYARSDASLLGAEGISQSILEIMAQTKRHLFIPKRFRPSPTPTLRFRLAMVKPYRNHSSLP